MRRVLVMLVLAFPWFRFKFNQWSSRTEFGIVTYWRWYTNDDVAKATEILKGALQDYVESETVLFNLYASGKYSREQLQFARQDMDDAMHRYRALLRLARYFRAKSFTSFPEVLSSRQAMRIINRRPIMPMGFAN